MAKKRKLGALRGPLLTKYLRALAVEIHTMTKEGDLESKAEALAKLVWKEALGYEEEDPDNPDKKIRHNPQIWAVSLLFDRIEGRVPTTVVDPESHSLPDKVSELGKAKINSFATASTSSPSDSDKTDDRDD